MSQLGINALFIVAESFFDEAYTCQCRFNHLFVINEFVSPFVHVIIKQFVWLNQKGYSDMEARVGRTGRTFGLGFKLYLSIDSKTMLPLSCTFASTDQNEQKHSLNLLDKTKLILKQSEAKLRSVIVDSQYSNSKLRNAVEKTVILIGQIRSEMLRVDKKFRTYGPQDQKREYHKRPHIEAVYSFLKTQYNLAINKVRGLGNVAYYALFSMLCLVLNREAAENIRRQDKAISPTYFNA